MCTYFYRWNEKQRTNIFYIMFIGEKQRDGTEQIRKMCVNNTSVLPNTFYK